MTVQSNIETSAQSEPAPLPTVTLALVEGPEGARASVHNTGPMPIGFQITWHGTVRFSTVIPGGVSIALPEIDP